MSMVCPLESFELYCLKSTYLPPPSLRPHPMNSTRMLLVAAALLLISNSGSPQIFAQENATQAAAAADPAANEESPAAKSPTTDPQNDDEAAEETTPTEVGPAEVGPAVASPYGPSYSLMGEFAGEIQTDGEEAEQIGLQIRPMGENGFEAIQYTGGLPGQPAQKGNPVQLVGRRSDGFVTLSGGPFVIIVEEDGCILLDRKGTQIGNLARVNRQSPTLGAKPPKDAIVIFDGTSTDQFSGANMTKDGLLMQGATLKPMLQDFDLHLEFRLPYMPEQDGQSRSNSGIYVQSRYECQILDSFATPAVFNGLGAIYRFRKPDVNMCLPPLVWQTYDIRFTAPRWEADGSKRRNAHITSWVNGVKVQDNIEVPQQTGHGKEETPSLLPIVLQDHGNDVRFRNIWAIDRGIASEPFPAEGL